VKVIDGQRNLMQIVFALHGSSGFACRLDGRQKQPNQNTDDCDDD
jgi:hypothetical protein